MVENGLNLLKANNIDIREKFLLYLLLSENCPNTEFFLTRIFLYSVPIQENTDQKKLRIWTLFKQCKLVDLQMVYNFQKLLQKMPIY